MGDLFFEAQGSKQKQLSKRIDEAKVDAAILNR